MINKSGNDSHVTAPRVNLNKNSFNYKYLKASSFFKSDMEDCLENMKSLPKVKNSMNATFFNLDQTFENMKSKNGLAAQQIAKKRIKTSRMLQDLREQKKVEQLILETA